MQNASKAIWFVWVIVFAIVCCTDKASLMGEPEMIEKNLRFTGHVEDQDHVLTLLDEILKAQGNFGVYGDLSTGLADVLEANGIDIEGNGTLLNISIYPLSGQGHDFSFVVDTEQKELRDLTVGEIMPEPDVKPPMN